MPLYCTEFVFDGKSSKEYDLIIGSFDGGQNGEATAGNNIEFTTFKAPNSNQWVKTSAAYNEPLSFTFQICKNPYVSKEPFSERELAFLMRWLVQKDYKYLQFIQQGFEHIFYRCQLNAERYLIGGECYGLTLTAACDAPYGWSDRNTTTISSLTDTTVRLYDSSDEIGIIYPAMKIVSNAGPQDIIISNALTSDVMKINNCIAGEEITIQDMKIKSSECYKASDNKGYAGNHLTFFDDFNWKWFSIGNTFENRINEITVTGNCTVNMNWRVPRKAVV